MTTEKPTRRLILKAGAIAGGSLMLGLRLSTPAQADAPPAAGDFVPNAFVRIDRQGLITLILPHTEVGQGVYTSSAMLMAEELEVGLDQVTVQAAPPDLARYLDPLLYDQATGGSTSTRSDWIRLREAAATARTMLVAVAGHQWQVDVSTCSVDRGTIHHRSTGRSIRYGEVVGAAAKQPVPKNVKLKDPADFKLIGTEAKRIDTPLKVNGKAIYGIDIRLPGMRFGTLANSPVKGGKVLAMNEAAARKIPGVRDIIRAGDDVVAVIGDHMWAAKQGLAALEIVWSAGANGTVTTATLLAAMDKASLVPGVVAAAAGDANAAIAGAVTKLSAVYDLPFLSHSPMEPLNCTLHIQADRAEIWVGTQVPVRAQKSVAAATGLPIDKVKVNNQLMGGAFGRRLEVDSVDIAVAIAKQVRYPLKLVWTREEDLQHDYYRPAYHDRVSAGLDADGKLVGRTHRVTGPSILARWAPPAFVNGLDGDAVECTKEVPYDIPASLVDYVRHEPEGMNTSWWRGVGATHNVFVVESFIDELAAAAKQDPLVFRRGMLQKNPRALAVMELAAEKAGWGSKLPPRVGRGISVQFAFGTYLACVIEAEVTKAGDIVLHRAVVAVDCGMTVNPNTVHAQTEGGLILGLGTALFNEITVTGGAVDQSNFHDYRALRINETPKIEVFQIRNAEKPGGVGEAGTAAAAPALGNAIFAATGQRLRRLPFGNGQMKAG